MAATPREKPTYVVEKTCPICEEKTRVVKTRSRVLVIKTDRDLCTHYQGVIPYYYRIWVCEHCGYAEDERHFTKGLPEKSKAKIRAFLKGREVHLPFHDPRTQADAIASYKLALYYAKLTEAESLAHVAGLNLNLAWVYRTGENKGNERENEQAFLREAGRLYEKALMTERFPQGQMTEADCTYLIGAIYLELKEYDQAAKYISLLRQDKELETRERTVAQNAKELWQDLREEMKAAKAEKAKVAEAKG